MPVATWPAVPIINGPRITHSPAPARHRFIPIWSSSALATNKVIAKLRKAAPSAAAISSPAWSGATGSIHSALSPLAIAPRIARLAAAVNSASTPSQNKRPLCNVVIPASPRTLSFIQCALSSGQPQHRAIERRVAAPREIVERLVGLADHVRGDEGRAFARAVFGMLQAAFPFEYRPAGIAILCQPGENPAEIELPVAQRAEAAGAIDPALQASSKSGVSGKSELVRLDVGGWGDELK